MKKPPKTVATKSRNEQARKNAMAFVFDLELSDPPVEISDLAVEREPDEQGYYSFRLVRGKRSIIFSVMPWPLERVRGPDVWVRVYIDGSSWSWLPDLAVKVARSALADPDKKIERARKASETAADDQIEATNGRCPTCSTVLEKREVVPANVKAPMTIDDFPAWDEDVKGFEVGFEVVCLTCTPETRIELRRAEYPGDLLSAADAATVTHFKITYQLMPHEVLGADDFIDPDTGGPDPEACCPTGFRSHDGKGQCIRRYKHEGDHAYRRKEISRELVRVQSR